MSLAPGCNRVALGRQTSWASALYLLATLYFVTLNNYRVSTKAAYQRLHSVAHPTGALAEDHHWLVYKLKIKWSIYTRLILGDGIGVPENKS
ncbi:unnamed protein product [Sphenostylis stenocarpa]|uniref:Uncharacterized protein n=1 Tax=Sphenostylis stenocarpa TaxID=92480 RepID=A0AA86SSA4_9FABA|nr:unnamed protein product [Sphenostylis stenocarpa]